MERAGGTAVRQFALLALSLLAIACSLLWLNKSFGSSNIPPDFIDIIDTETGERTTLVQNERDNFFYEWSPNSEQILFTSGRRGISEIYKIDVGDENLVQLTKDRARASSPTWSPNGEQIAFTFSRDKSELYPNDIYVMDANGGNVRRLTNDDYDKYTLSWSPSGSEIFYASSADSITHAVNVEGGARQSPSWGAIGFSAEGLSSNGKITFVYSVLERGGHENVDIYTVDITGENRTRLTDHAARDVSPSWSPDGQLIAFESYRNAMISHLYLMNADGSNIRQLTNLSNPIFFHDWSPDGESILFVTEHDRDLFTIDIETGTVTQLTDAPDDAGISHAAWSPDGRYIAVSISYPRPV